MAKAAYYLETLAEIFGDDLYLELQPGRFSEQLEYNDFLVCLAEKYNLKAVITNDVHYLSKEDSDAHNYHVLDCRKSDGIDGSFVYPDTCYYLMSETELRSSIVKTSFVTEGVINTALEHTLEIAEKCSLVIPQKRIMPVYAPEIDEDKEEIARLFLETGYSRLPVYEDDLDNIMGVLNQKDFHNYIKGTDADVSEYVKPVIFVAGSMKISQLLKRLQTAIS